MADSIRGVVIANGIALPNALVRVYIAGTATLASLFSDEALSVPVTNDGVTGPLSDSDGSYGPFYAKNGRYDLRFVKTGYTFTDADSAGILIEDSTNVRALTTGTYSVDGDSDSLILCDCAGGNITLNLPQISTLTRKNRPINIIKIDSSANKVTVNRGGADTINGLTSFVLDSYAGWQYRNVVLRGTGTTWFKSDILPLVTPVLMSAATASSSQTFTSGAQAKVNLATELFDTHGVYNTSTSEITPPPGKYLILASMPLISAVTSLATVEAWIMKNAVDITLAYGTAINSTQMQVRLYVAAIANGTDYFWFNIRPTGVGTITSDTRSHIIVIGLVD